MNADEHIRAGLVRNLRPLAVAQIHIVGLAHHDNPVAARKQNRLQLLRHNQIQFILRNLRKMPRRPGCHLCLQRGRIRPVGLLLVIPFALVSRVNHHQPSASRLAAGGRRRRSGCRCRCRRRGGCRSCCRCLCRRRRLRCLLRRCRYRGYRRRRGPCCCGNGRRFPGRRNICRGGEFSFPSRRRGRGPHLMLSLKQPVVLFGIRLVAAGSQHKKNRQQAYECRCNSSAFCHSFFRILPSHFSHTIRFIILFPIPKTHASAIVIIPESREKIKTFLA